jgi:hypothetical protein
LTNLMRHFGMSVKFSSRRASFLANMNTYVHAK